MTLQVANNDVLSEYTDDKRLQIYKIVTSACTHLYSKGKLQEDKFVHVAEVFADLAINDPIFMAHLTAWAARGESKDLKVLTVFFNSLNDANGTAFFKGSKNNKPNFRQASFAVLQQLDPHLVLRVLQLAHKRFEVKGLLNNSRHFPTGLKTAFKKYLGYREANLGILRGAKKAGLTKKLQQIYRFTRTAPSDDAAAILRWKQSDGRDIVTEDLPDFNAMTSQEIAAELEKTKLAPTVALSVVPQDKITAKVAKALLANATGNQSIILYNWFASNGFLDVKAISELFKDKVKTATTVVDRIDTLTKDADEEDKKEMAQIRSHVRKKSANTGSLGKIFLHIDCSSSMNEAIDFAKEKASVIAECVDNPAENFGWGLFGPSGQVLPVPNGFTKEDFYGALYGVRASGRTDCIALYGVAREFGAEIDIYVTDQGHNVGTINKRIKCFHDANPQYPLPKAVVIVDFPEGRGGYYNADQYLEPQLKKLDIPVAILEPKALTESALIPQAVRAALVGELAIIDEILDVPLPTLPNWWNTIQK